MGKLVVKVYRTPLALKLADHTYVECASGAKGWSCWGGKTGGKAINADVGSTTRADAIAEPNERAGITCYAINGVCHQAANRILLATNITVKGARGYGLSVALFSPYGRPAGPFESCAAPLNRHVGVTGDLDDCSDMGPTIDLVTDSDKLESLEREASQETLALYERPSLTAPSKESRISFQLAQFEIFAMHRLQRGSSRLGELLGLHREFEVARNNLEDQLAGKTLSGTTFVKKLNDMTMRYQEDLAHRLPPSDYSALLDSDPGERLLVCDPSVFSTSPDSSNRNDKPRRPGPR